VLAKSILASEKKKMFRFLNTNQTPLILPKGINEKAAVLTEAGGFCPRFTVLNTMHLID